MKAFVVKEIGSVGFMDKPVPEPGPTDAVVRTTKALICTSDSHTVRGGIGPRTNLTLGHEGVGVVHAVGGEVRDVRPGDRVPAGAITPDWGDLAAQNGYPSQSGGPLGGFKFATAGARLRGAGLVIGVESVPGRQELARFYGADVIVDFAEEDVVERVHELTDGQGMDTAIEALGADVTFQTAVKVTRPGGTISVIGYVGQREFVHIPRVEWGVGHGRQDDRDRPVPRRPAPHGAAAAGAGEQAPRPDPAHHPPLPLQRDGAGLRGLGQEAGGHREGAGHLRRVRRPGSTVRLTAGPRSEPVCTIPIRPSVPSADGTATSRWRISA
ncbi:zinc-binding dehydrogenase [Streptomyces sp. SUK 48]|uniref:zinc-binding dehydrogenase n=1 Tax=Streptomyces sp. SUK 48 TaxID=2582831 RepID=UPI001FB91DCA|nr:zinc-binding dehydrogenase [Streptomyces sp. SUK 48]